MWELVSLAKKGNNPAALGALIFVGGGFVLRGLKSFKRKRKTEDTPTSKISSAAQGLVELQGVAWPLAPIKCSKGLHLAYYELEVQEYVKRNKHSSWETIYKYQSDSDFLVLDSTGVAVVRHSMDRSNSEFVLDDQITSMDNLGEFSWQILESNIPMIARYLDRPRTGFLKIFSRSKRIVERKIMAAGPVYIQGSFRTDSNSHVLSLGKLSYLKSKIQDVLQHQTIRDPKHGGEAALSALKLKLYQHVHASLKQAANESTEIRGMVEPSASHHLIIADGNEATYLRKLVLWKCLAWIGGGLALVLLGILGLMSFSKSL